MSLYVLLRDAVCELEREGRTGAAKVLTFAKGIIAKARRPLQDEAAPEAPELDRDARDEATEAAKVKGDRADQRARGRNRVCYCVQRLA